MPYTVSPYAYRRLSVPVSVLFSVQGPNSDALLKFLWDTEPKIGMIDAALWSRLHAVLWFHQQHISAIMRS